MRRCAGLPRGWGSTPIASSKPGAMTAPPTTAAIRTGEPHGAADAETRCVLPRAAAGVPLRVKARCRWLCAVCERRGNAKDRRRIVEEFMTEVESKRITTLLVAAYPLWKPSEAT